MGIRFNRSFSGRFGNMPMVNEYTLGLAYYVLNNAFKLQTDYTFIQNKVFIYSYRSMEISDAIRFINKLN